jgi:RNA polymerase sigma factor (sigma-70 family)
LFQYAINLFFPVINDMKSNRTENRIDQFFMKEYKKLVSFVQKNMNKRYADAAPEDIVQEVALGLLDKLNIDVQIENLAAYFYRSLRNKIYDTQTKKRAEVSIENFATTNNEVQLNKDLSGESEEIVISQEFESHQLMEAIGQLNQEDKYIIMETHFKGKSFHELSIELNTPLGTLLSRKHRAQAKLSKILLATRTI